MVPIYTSLYIAGLIFQLRYREVLNSKVGIFYSVAYLQSLNIFIFFVNKTVLKIMCVYFGSSSNKLIVSEGYK